MIMQTSRQATREELAKRVDELQEKLDKQDKEIETYKKIAEKLAKYIEENSKGIICNFYEANLQKDDCVDINCNKCIIDWAKGEVINENK